MNAVRPRHAVRVFALVAASCLASAALAQDGTIELVPRWQKGEKHQYLRTKSRLKERDGKVLADGAGRTDVEVEVLDADKDGYVLGWTYGETTSDDPKIAANPLLKRMSNLVTGLQFQLRINRRGEFAGINNVAELEKKFARVIDEVVELNGTLSNAQKEQLRSTLRTTLLSKQGLEEIMAKEPRLFLMAFGLEHSAKGLMAQGKLPLPLGGAQVTTRVEYRLKALDRDKKLATIVYKQEIDPEDGARAVAEIIRQLAKQAGAELPAGDALKLLNVNDAAEMRISTDSGWPQHVSFTRSIVAQGARQRDVITISKKE